MYVYCDCGNNTYHISIDLQLRGFAECAECGERQQIGGYTEPNNP